MNCNTGPVPPTAVVPTWTSKVPKRIAHMPFILGIEAIILGTCAPASTSPWAQENLQLQAGSLSPRDLGAAWEGRALSWEVVFMHRFVVGFASG